MTRSDYIELRARSAFSFLEGASAPEDLVARAAELGYNAIALGDRDGLYGAPRFYHSAIKAGVKALVGAELTLDDDSRLYVLVPDRERYRNLCRMITASKMRVLNEAEVAAGEAPKYPVKGESRITLDDLGRYGHGLICLAGGVYSPLSRMLIRGEDPRALCDRLCRIFGRGNFHIDVQRHLDAGEERLNRKLAALADSAHLPIVASNDVHHSGNERALLDVLTCIRLKTTLDAAGRALWVNNERYLKPPAEMASLFRDLPGAVTATRAITERCDFTLKDLGYRFPDYPLPPGETPDSYLRILTWAGARERWGGAIDARTRNQLEHELTMIAKLKLAGYFLIVWDIVEFCRENAIMAQGRGSAANSAVCYALGITAVDAVKMELLFERFLSEERGEWPDIDIDLPSGDQREKAIQYVYRRYGERGAAMTANVITYRTRSAIREVGKALGFSLEQVDRLAKLNRTFEFRDQHDDVAELLRGGGVDADAPRIRMLVDLVRQIQSLPRHLGQHSGGMVIAAGPLDDVVPLEPATMPGRVVIQWDKEDCADLGIIKVDLLGLGMLAVLEEAIPLIKTHENVAIDLAHLPADDPEVYAMLRKADTVGVFQVESRAQMATLPRMKPRTFYDLVVEVAIIRPGPIVGQMVHPYLDRRNGRAPVGYLHPSLEPILRRTLGVPLFQEQLLRIAMTAAGFSGGEAEELRRAMGFKRSMARMEKIEDRLREGMARKGISGRAADEIVRSITSFALYGFPESHAASFALIAYASAYLKCHHAPAFFAAMLNCYPMGFYHPATLVKDAQHHGVIVLPIDVTRSNWKCTIEQSDSHLLANEESYSHPHPSPLPGQGEGCEPTAGCAHSTTNVILSEAKNPEGSPGSLPRRALQELQIASRRSFVSEAFAQQDDKQKKPVILSKAKDRREAIHQFYKGHLAIRLGLKYIDGLREETGQRIESERARAPFTSIADFTARAGPNRRELDTLAHAGALGAFGMARREALWQAAAVERDTSSLFAGVEPRRGDSPLPAMTALEETRADYVSTGITVGPHLIAHIRSELRARGVLSASELADAKNGLTVRVAGLVIVRQRPGTAKGFFFATLEDETGIANAIVTPDIFQRNRVVLQSAAVLMVEGVLQKQDGVTSVKGRRFAEIHISDQLPASRDFR
jgi:error-prone DNA polymerase